MKKLLVFLLLSVFLYNQAGYFITFKMEQYTVRKEIKRKIKNSVPQGELTVIKISDHNRNSIQWVKEGKEFIYNNSFFDVVRLETNGDEVIYHCINDTQEKQLFVDLDEHVRKHMDADGADHKHSAKSMIKDYFPESSTPAFFIPYEVLYYPLISEAPVECPAKNSVPPPERS